MTASRRHPGGARPRAAFTLLEVILAIGLALTAVASVIAYYRFVLQVRRQILQDAQIVAVERTVKERLTDELRGAIVYPFLGMGLEGGAEQVRLITATVPGPAVWAVRRNAEDPIPPENDLQIVSYRLRIAVDDQGNPILDEDGNRIVLGLERTCQRYLSAASEEGQDIQVALLSADVKFLNLRYWDGGAWRPSWSSRDLPLAVELTLGREPLDRDQTPEEYPYETSRRVIYVPGGTRALGVTTVIRGLDSGGAP